MTLPERSTAAKLWIKDIVQGKFVKGEQRFEPNVVVTPLNESVSRVRILGTVVSRFTSEDGKYATITLDDTTETIAVRTFREGVELLQEVKPGDIVDVIGKVKEYEEERYINPETVWRIEDPNWELVRKLELALKERALREKASIPTSAAAQETGATETEKVTITPSAMAQETGAIETKSVVKEESIEIKKESPTEIKPEVEEEVVSEGEDPKMRVLEIIETLDKGEGVKYVTLLGESGLEEEKLTGVLRELMNEGEVYEPKIGWFRRV